jgi:hypothetical protein
MPRGQAGEIFALVIRLISGLALFRGCKISTRAIPLNPIGVSSPRRLHPCRALGNHVPESIAFKLCSIQSF